MTSPTHDELKELTGAYVLGMLGEAERQTFATHLSTCSECAREVREMSLVVAALPHTVPQHDPPEALRARVLREAVAGSAHEGRVGPALRERRRLPAWLATAASIAAVGLFLYSLSLRERIADLERRLREANTKLAAAQSELQIAQASADRGNRIAAVLEAPDVRRIDLAGQKAAPGAAGRAFWSPSRGMIFTATNLPTPDPGRQYQLWVIPPGSTDPISAGMLDLDTSGRTIAFVAAPTVAQVGTVAVTLEPAGGVPKPTGQMALAGTL
jgi:anti-sigma-K factor RskA